MIIPKKLDPSTKPRLDILPDESIGESVFIKGFIQRCKIDAPYSETKMIKQFSNKLNREIEQSELQWEIDFRMQRKNADPKTIPTKPFRTVKLVDCEVVPKNPADPTIAEEYFQTRIYEGQPGEDGIKHKFYEIIDKSRFDAIAVLDNKLNPILLKEDENFKIGTPVTIEVTVQKFPNGRGYKLNAVKVESDTYEFYNPVQSIEEANANAKARFESLGLFTATGDTQTSDTAPVEAANTTPVTTDASLPDPTSAPIVNDDGNPFFKPEE